MTLMLHFFWQGQLLAAGTGALMAAVFILGILSSLAIVAIRPLLERQAQTTVTPGSPSFSRATPSRVLRDPREGDEATPVERGLAHVTPTQDERVRLSGLLIMALVGVWIVMVLATNRRKRSGLD